ncbi:MAG: thioredoxin [Candidatus Thermoplasmatota archaeon]
MVIRMDELEEIRARKIAELERYAKDLELQKTAKPIHLTDDTFPGEVAKPGVLLVDMWAAWCGPCLRIAPTIEQLAKDYGGKVRFGKVNVDENPRTAAQFGIQSIPALLLFKNGKLVDGIIGAVPRQEIEGVLRRWL